ncbi:Cyclin-B1-2 [Camellia lanceoleosa]|uniref:Cyclin-B1-2 n=1 Tax=Camellia lanceoleosa TaxID=1840588 RepID=A0ACC0IVJ5_9ERIC|nr:Cyclin-B1-2 [Camellia lanceoleosa]
MEAANTEKAIAHEIGGIQNDTFRFGFHSVKSDIVGSHPLQSAYQSTKEVQEQMKRRILLNTYGSALPLKMDLDRQMLSRFQRPPGPIPSSMLGLEALTGSLDGFGFEDYLSDPHESETFRPVDMHHGMEVQLGLSKGQACPSFI